MELFLMVLSMSLLGVALSALAFSAATRGEASREQARPAPLRAGKPVVTAPVAQIGSLADAFFVHDAALEGIRTRVPIEVLLRRLESHVRLEQAAAESFLMAPTLESLHTRTTSPLVH